MKGYELLKTFARFWQTICCFSRQRSRESVTVVTYGTDLTPGGRTVQHTSLMTLERELGAQV